MLKLDIDPFFGTFHVFAVYQLAARILPLSIQTIVIQIVGPYKVI